MNKTYNKLGSQSIFSYDELRSNGFIPVSHPAFTFNKDTFEQGGENDIPCVTLTYRLGEYSEQQVRWAGLNILEKNEIISKIREANLFWIFSVYFGEIYITKDDPTRRFTLFVRGARKKSID
jgi:hypothetical protein